MSFISTAVKIDRGSRRPAASAPALGLALLLAACGGGGGASPVTSEPYDTGPETARTQPFGRGVNLGEMLEAPHEGDWGPTLHEEYFAVIQAKGFDTVRLPVRWSAHAGAGPSYTIDGAFMTRVNQMVDAALAQGLKVVLDCHHWSPEYGLFQSPETYHDEFIELWKQIATQFRDKSDALYLEPLNEPLGNLAAVWNDLLAEVVVAIRAIDTTHTLVVTGPQGGAYDLNDLRLPDDDNLVATFHFYSPFTFTHQGASWTPQFPAGVPWPGRNPAAATRAIRDELDVAKAWSDAHPDVPVLLGEFGAIAIADVQGRANWIGYVRKQAELRGFGFTYWSFAGNFAIYDTAAGAWDPLLTEALGVP
jgi:endoglucanase